jgi:hypothetical protein
MHEHNMLAVPNDSLLRTAKHSAVHALSSGIVGILLQISYAAVLSQAIPIRPAQDGL